MRIGQTDMTKLSIILLRFSEKKAFYSLRISSSDQ